MPLPPGIGRPESYPLTPIQQGMLFDCLLGASPGVHIEQVQCSLSETLDVEALTAAWQHLFDRHEALRASF